MTVALFCCCIGGYYYRKLWVETGSNISLGIDRDERFIQHILQINLSVLHSDSSSVSSGARREGGGGGEIHLLDALSSGNIPDFAQLGVIPSQKQSPFRIKCNRPDACTVAAICLWPTERCHFTRPVHTGLK